MTYAIQHREDFQAQVVDASEQQPVLVFFRATWCGPCNQIAPKFEEYSQQYGKAAFVKVDLDENEELGVEYKIENMPEFRLFSKGKVVSGWAGADVQKLQDELKKNVPN